MIPNMFLRDFILGFLVSMGDWARGLVMILGTLYGSLPGYFLFFSFSHLIG